MEGTEIIPRWQYGGREHRLRQYRGSWDRYGSQIEICAMERFDGGDTGWLELARWRCAEDGPTFGGLANRLLAGVAAAGHETSGTITAWSTATFGPLAPGAEGTEKAFERAGKEWAELQDIVRHNGGAHPMVPREAADVVICLAPVFARHRTDMQTEIDRKMKINRAREWTLNGDGTGQHK